MSRCIFPTRLIPHNSCFPGEWVCNHNPFCLIRIWSIGHHFLFSLPPQKLLFFFAFIWQSVKEIFLPPNKLFARKSLRKKSGGKNGKPGALPFSLRVWPRHRASEHPAVNILRFMNAVSCRYPWKQLHDSCSSPESPKIALNTPFFQRSEILAASRFLKWFIKKILLFFRTLSNCWFEFFMDCMSSRMIRSGFVFRAAQMSCSFSKHVSCSTSS